MEYKRSFFLKLAQFIIYMPRPTSIFTRSAIYYSCKLFICSLFCIYQRLALLFGYSFIRSYGTYGYGLPVMLFILCRLLDYEFLQGS